MAAPPPVLVGIPIRSFSNAWIRMSDGLAPKHRQRLATATAGRVVDAFRTTGAPIVVVTPDDDVGSWARARGCSVLEDLGTAGLDGAAALIASTAADVGTSWVVCHADLPAISTDDALRVLDAAPTGVIAPSRDGGTNLVGNDTPIQFSYGPNSFARHLTAFVPKRPSVVTAPGTALDMDHVADIRVAATLPQGRWLESYLT